MATQTLISRRDLVGITAVLVAGMAITLAIAAFVFHRL